MRPSIYNITLKKHPAEVERDNLKLEAADLRNALYQKDVEINSLKNSVSNLSQKDSEINSLKGIISGTNINLSQKDNEINSLKNIISGINVNLSQKDKEINSLKSTISSNVLTLSRKDEEFVQLKKEIEPLQEKLAEHNRLTNEKMEMVYLLKTGIEELRLDKIDLRKDKILLVNENELLKKQLLDFSMSSDDNHLNVPGSLTEIMGHSIHTVESEILNNETILIGNNVLSNFNL